MGLIGARHASARASASAEFQSDGLSSHEPRLARLLSGDTCLGLGLGLGAVRAERRDRQRDMREPGRPQPKPRASIEEVAVVEVAVVVVAVVEVAVVVVAVPRGGHWVTCERASSSSTPPPRSSALNCASMLVPGEG